MSASQAHSQAHITSLYHDPHNQTTQSNSVIRAQNQVQEKYFRAHAQQSQPQSGLQQMSFIICGGPTDALTTAARREVRSQAAKHVSRIFPPPSRGVVDLYSTSPPTRGKRQLRRISPTVSILSNERSPQAPIDDHAVVAKLSRYRKEPHWWLIRKTIRNRKSRRHLMHNHLLKVTPTMCSNTMARTSWADVSLSPTMWWIVWGRLLTISYRPCQRNRAVT